jgi:hypothetical protein
LEEYLIDFSKKIEGHRLITGPLPSDLNAEKFFSGSVDENGSELTYGGVGLPTASPVFWHLLPEVAVDLGVEAVVYFCEFLDVILAVLL